MKIQNTIIFSFLSIALVVVLFGLFVEKLVETPFFSFVLFSLSASIVVFGGALSFYLANPIKELTNVVEDVSTGKLNVNIDPKLKNANEEVGKLASAIDRTLVSLKLAVKQVGLSKKELELGTALKEKKQFENELKQSEAFVHNVIEHAGFPIIAFTKQGKLMIANEQLYSLTGYTKEEVSSPEKWMDLAYPDKLIHRRIEKAIADVYKGKKKKDFVIPLHCKDGSNVIVISNITAITDAENNIIGEVIFMQDLSKIFDLESDIRNWAFTDSSEETKVEKKPTVKYDISQPIRSVTKKR